MATNFPQFFMEISFSYFKRLVARRLATTPSSFSGSKDDAVEVFASRTFASVPACWIAELLEHRGQSVAMPMYGYLFLIEEESVEQAVERNLGEFDFGEDAERQSLVESGWRVISPTGFFALPLDGRILLGIDGVGYDFFKAHWEPLYDLLGNEWHLDD